MSRVSPFVQVPYEDQRPTVSDVPPDPGPRRWRPVADLDPFELSPLLGMGSAASDLKQLAQTLRNSFALERQTEEGSWQVVGCTASQDRADAWVANGGEPDHDECPP